MTMDPWAAVWVPVNDSYDSASDALDAALDQYPDRNFRIWQFDAGEDHPRDVTLDAIDERHALFASETPPRDIVIHATVGEREAA